MNDDYPPRDVFSWTVTDADTAVELLRMLNDAAGSFHVSSAQPGLVIEGAAPVSVIAMGEKLIQDMEDWELHKPEVVEYYSRKETEIFRRAMTKLFPNAPVYKPLPFRRGHLSLYGARSEHKQLQENILMETIEEFFSQCRH